MRILAIESTCDETAASIVEICGSGVKVHSNTVASSVDLYQKYGGIVPEVAAREQVMSIIPVINEALKVSVDTIEAIAVSYGPGLMGSLLIGVETAKVLSWSWSKPLLRVNHMTGHVLANWIVKNESQPTPEFPAIGLVVSGGHTDILLLKDFRNWEWVGGTRDDAVGEAFDKTARILGLPYPGGPAINSAALKVTDGEWNNLPKEMKLPRPMINEENLEMSFSGIKAAANRLIEKNPKLNEMEINLLAKEFSEAVIDVLIKKTILAVEKYSPKSVLLAGGVAANSMLRERLKEKIAEKPEIDFFVPDLKYCGDNAAMIGTSALLRPEKVDLALKPEPSLLIN